MSSTNENIKIPSITDLIVRKSNVLIESGTNMNLMEQRIILMTMTQIFVDDFDFNTYSFTVPQLAKIFGLDSTSLHKEIKKVSDSLMEKFFRIPKGNANDFRNQSVVDYIDYSSGVLTIKLAEGLKSELLNLKKSGHFTSFELQEIVKLKKTSSMRLYELLIRDSRLRRKKDYWVQSYSLKDLRELLHLENRYSDFRSFNQKVLKPSIEDINKNTSLNVEIKAIRSARVVSQLQFKMKNKTKKTFSDYEREELIQKIEKHLSKSTEEEKMLYDDILEEEKLNSQLPLFNDSEMHKDIIRNNALERWFSQIKN